jgi:hypothetical protein
MFPLDSVELNIKFVIVLSTKLDELLLFQLPAKFVVVFQVHVAQAPPLTPSKPEDPEDPLVPVDPLAPEVPEEPDPETVAYLISPVPATLVKY